MRIVDEFGQVHAKATFQPPGIPRIGPAAPLLQSPIRVAAGAVYFADSAGTIHKLTPDGTASVVATFPLTSSQQQLAYAVSPDGAHLIAIVFSTPPLHSPPPQSADQPLYAEGGHWTLTLQTADAGGSTTTVLTRDLGTVTVQPAAYPKPTLIVGWDSKGPIATLNSNIGTQGGQMSKHLFGSPLIHLASDGTHLDVVGGVDCEPVDEIADGTVLCGSWTSSSLSVRTSAGAVIWQVPTPQEPLIGAWLSPDGNAIAAPGIVITRTGPASGTHVDANGSTQQSPQVGWLDADTVVMVTATGELVLYDVRTFAKIRDLGVQGVFEGVL